MMALPLVKIRVRAFLLLFRRNADVEQRQIVVPFARRCFTSANGYPVAYLKDPEFAWRMKDPRMRALAGGQATARQVSR